MIIMDSICQSSGKKISTGRLINEDGLINFTVDYNQEQYNFSILMDGATGLGKYYEIKEGLTSAEWYVEFILSEMKKIFSKNPTVRLNSVVEESIFAAINKINNYEKTNNIILEEYQKPSAGLSLLRTDGKTTDIFLIGDAGAIINYTDNSVSTVDSPNQHALQTLDKRVLSKMVELSKSKNCDVADTRFEPEIESMLRSNRSKKNTNNEDSYWVCGTTPGTANHGSITTFDNSTIDSILLHTDGFDYSVLNLDEKELFNLIKEHGIEYVAQNIREVQAADPKCNKFPRFKQYDDLTAIFLDYSSN